jgi:RRXRR protein
MQLRVPVLNPDNTPAMPTKPSRARRMVRDGKAVSKWSDAGIYCIQLINQPSGTQCQPVAMGIDPGKKFSGIAVQSDKATLYLAHLILPFAGITKKMTARRILRRARRGKRIDRRKPFQLRSHRQKRFDNRKKSKLPPSIRANRQLEFRIARQLCALFPISNIVYEYVEAKGSKSFSPVMVGQKVMLGWLEELAPVTTQFGWQTALIRERLGLVKTK